MSKSFACEDPEALTVRSASGETLLLDVMHWVIYIRVSNAEFREQAAGSIRTIVRAFEGAGPLDYIDFEGNQQPLHPDSLEELLQTRLVGRLRAPNANVIVESRALAVPEFHLWLNGKHRDREDDPEASYLHLWTPTKWFIENQQRASALFEGLLSDLPFSMGYLSRGVAGNDWRRKQAMCARYPNIDIADPLCVSADLGDSVAGVYWITAISNSLGDRLNWSDVRLERILNAGLHRRTATGAHIFTLEDGPNLCDRNRRMSPAPAYLELARALDDAEMLHVPDRVVYFFDANGMADRDAMKAWHRRYLAM